MIGPDAARYLHAADGVKVSRPFCWRWLLPSLLGTGQKAWWWCWAVSWAVTACGALWFMANVTDGWQRMVAGTIMLLALPGILGPPEVIPVGVDLPATALGLLGAAMFTGGHPEWVVGGIILCLLAGTIKETTPVFVALWAWTPWALIGLAAPAARFLWVHLRHLEGPDSLGGVFQDVLDHPIRTALAAHRHLWRNAWVMVAPWGLTLAALHSVSWQLAVVLAVAHLQLLVATDTVRLVHHAAGPVMAAAAVSNIPTQWLALAVVAHTCWWFKVERV